MKIGTSLVLSWLLLYSTIFCAPTSNSDDEKSNNNPTDESNDDISGKYLLKSNVV